MSKIFVWFLLTAMVIIIAAGSSYCAENEQSEIKTVDGQVISTDWVRSMFTVQWLNADGEVGYLEKTFFVPEGFRITKGAGTIGFIDIENGNRVMVEYEESEKGPTIKSIVIKE